MDQVILDAIKDSSPLSAFLYGSQAHGDATTTSDYEIGLIFDDENYVSRREIHDRVKLDNVRIYPFRLSELKNYRPDTPFPRKLYMRELISFGRTIYGEKVIENLPRPKLTTVDLLGVIRFEIGLAYGAFRAHRSLGHDAADYAFFKSCVYGARCLILLSGDDYPINYAESLEMAKDLTGNDEFKVVLDAAHDYRVGKLTRIDSDLIFRNMSFLTAIENQILDKYDSSGDCKIA
jgi:predicted nucleotidyltransferase